MKKKYFLMCMLSITSMLHAQNGSNGIYSSNNETVTLLEKPASRKVVGGTIINVKYEGSNISSTMKGAFEYACRLWEENIPTTYPINLTVQFANIQNTKCLATVEAVHSGNNNYYDKVFAKRYAQLPLENANNWGTLEFFRDSKDALIIFSTRQPFDYTLDGEKVNPNKYDFVTVALQAIGKALGFSLNAYASNMTLNRLETYNKYTACILTGQPDNDYTMATSGNAYISPSYWANNAKWNIHSPSTYDPRYSLNYFQKDPTNRETLIMQPDIISKGSAIRYIGEGMQVFFSFCGWDRPIATGSSSTVYQKGSTDEVIPYQEPKSQQVSEQARMNSLMDETLETYLFDRKEECEQGNYVLLKDGTWKKYINLYNLTENDDYARTSDGYLRLKQVSYSLGAGHYTNTNIAYKLYDYIPQRPKAGMNSFKASEFALKTTGNRHIMKTNTDTEYVDVEIGFQNVEGCTEIEVEQTDSDYPVPFLYNVDPSQGYFTAFMCKDYTSTFKLTYINKNGKTIGEPLIIDLRNAVSDDRIYDLNLKLDDRKLYYDLEQSNAELKSEGFYTINSLSNMTIKEKGSVIGNSGEIDISALPKGAYVLRINYGNNVYNAKWMKK